VIHTISVPTPFAVGRVNLYLIEDDPLTLVDTGPNSGIALDELEQGLAQLGHRVEDLGLLLLTHQHADHIGLTSILARRSGAEVAALAPLADWLGDFGTNMESDDRFAVDLMLRAGVAEDVTVALRAVSAAFRNWGSRADVTRRLHDGDEVVLRDRTYRVLHRPGHSPTDTIFHDEQRREIVGGDHLIAHISSNPVITAPPPGETERPKALLAYIDSLRRTQAMDVDTILPGHGEPVTGHAELIDQRLRMHDKRAAKILRLLGDGPLSAHEIAQRLWGKVALTQVYLTLSEVLGHTDLLCERGQVVEEDDDGVTRFRAV
jgi:glyoxylase-like metal-dependent hydrolase (beta-lactamase superfamily II)